MKVYVVFKRVSYGQYDERFERMQIVKIVRNSYELDQLIDAAALLGVEIEVEEHEVS